MNVEELTPEALKLPVGDRASLAAFLWESLEDPYSLSLDLSDEDALILAEKRDREVESGIVKAVSHADLMARLSR